MKTLFHFCRYCFTILLVALSHFSHGQCTISGRVVDEKNTPVLNVSVQLFQAGALKRTQCTDQNGLYSFMPISAGNYDMLVSGPGFDSIRVSCVSVTPGKLTTLNFQMIKPKNHPATENTHRINAWTHPYSAGIFQRDEAMVLTKCEQDKVSIVYDVTHCPMAVSYFELDTDNPTRTVYSRDDLSTMPL